MSGGKSEVIWSPVHEDKFIVWGPDITLYEVARLKDIEKNTTYTQISATRGATVLASQSASGVRCVDISAIPDQPDPLLALGHVNGRITLTSLKQTYDPLGLVGREFAPRYLRPCNSVAWSSVESNLLCGALEKHRSDHCVVLWDVHRAPPPLDNVGTEMTPSVMPSSKPLAEMGLSETAHSVNWSQCSPRTLIASMNHKFIKVFDLRDLSNKAVMDTTSRYCFDACADPLSEWQLCSRADNVACVWDLRRFHRPLLTAPQPRALLMLAWCPTRRNLLMSVQRDSTLIRLHDIQQANGDYKQQPVYTDDNAMATSQGVEAELEEQWSTRATVLERAVAPLPSPSPSPASSAPTPAPAPLAAAAWHPSRPACLLAYTVTGVLADYTVCERAGVGWGAGAGPAWAGAGGELRLASPALAAALRDVAHVMRARANTDYGLKLDLWQNADLAEDEALSGMWHFLALSKSLVEDGCIRNSPWRHPGVRGVLGGEGAGGAGGGGGYRSESVPSLLPDMPSRRVTIYKSVERNRALQACGWGWGWENAGLGVERAEAEGTPCRAAALAAFHLRLRTALDILARASSPQLRVVSLALAGLSEERLWREAAAAAAGALPDPYLRALLAFLSASQPHLLAPDLTPVLNETEMRLEDRVAFACIFLSDAKLQEYIATTTDQLVEKGDLAGILLTGASLEGVSLLQHWVEQTGDVQSAALVAARCFTPELLRDQRVQGWLDSYRTLLDSWKLWWARCALDTWVGAAGGGEAGGAPPHVTLTCNYCGKSVAAPAHHQRPRQAFARLPPPAAKMKQISSCPNCRKPLPRCAVCSLHLGTGAGGGGGGAAGGAAGGGGGAAFARWFSWCVACRHAGHAHHLIEWFKEHTECPVSSCNCRCITLDPQDHNGV